MSLALTSHANRTERFAAINETVGDSIFGTQLLSLDYNKCPRTTSDVFSCPSKSFAASQLLRGNSDLPKQW